MTGLLRTSVSVFLVLTLMMGVATADTGRAQDGDADIVIVVRVLPASPVVTISGELSAMIPEPDLSDPGATTVWLVLTVDDGRGSASGWNINLQQAESDVPDERLLFIDRQCAGGDEVGPSQGSAGDTCATMTAVDLPLAEPISVFDAGVGLGAGTSRIRFRFGSGRDIPDRPIVLIVSLPIAP